MATDPKAPLGHVAVADLAVLVVQRVRALGGVVMLYLEKKKKKKERKTKKRVMRP